MKQELYLNLKTSWQSIWEVVRMWILNNKNTPFKPTGDLPQRRPSGSREWKTDIERVKVMQLNDVLRVIYEKNTEGVIWYTELYFKRAKRSIYTRITVKPLGAAEPIEIKPPRIATMLQKRFGQMNEVKMEKQGTRNSEMGPGIAAGNVATKDDIERMIRHLDDKAAFARGKVWLKPAFMAMLRLFYVARAKYQLQDAIAVDKYTLLCEEAVKNPNCKSITRSGNLLYREELTALTPDIINHRGKAGYFFEYSVPYEEVPSAECLVQSAECRVPSAECRVPSAECRVPSAALSTKHQALSTDPSTKHLALSTLFSVITEKFQTITYFGIDPGTLHSALSWHRPHRPNRAGDERGRHLGWPRPRP